MLQNRRSLISRLTLITIVCIYARAGLTSHSVDLDLLTNHTSNIECPRGFYGYRCWTKCPASCSVCDSNGECIECSKPGFKLPRCTTVCDRGWYGQNCKHECDSACFNAECDSNVGYCLSCQEKGYSLPECSTPCKPGTFGIHCHGQCPVTCPDSCDRLTGVCTSCEVGEGPYCTVHCALAEHQESCSLHCPEKCVGLCNTTNRRCGMCTPGFKAPYCQEYCDPGTYGSQCNQNCSLRCRDRKCDPITGECAGCEDGYVGRWCNGRCIQGFYGLGCALPCPETCVDNLCHAETGDCKKCIIGYTGALCDLLCDSGKYGAGCSTNCPSKCRWPCNPVTGECQECLIGYRGNKCNSTCAKGSYGLSCNRTCPVGCLDDICHHETGDCSECKDYFHGPRCDKFASRSTQPLEMVVYSVLSLLTPVVLIGLAMVCYKHRSTTEKNSILTAVVEKERQYAGSSKMTQKKAQRARINKNEIQVVTEAAKTATLNIKRDIREDSRAVGVFSKPLTTQQLLIPNSGSLPINTSKPTPLVRRSTASNNVDHSKESDGKVSSEELLSSTCEDIQRLSALPKGDRRAFAFSSEPAFENTGNLQGDEAIIVAHPDQTSRDSDQDAKVSKESEKIERFFDMSHGIKHNKSPKLTTSNVPNIHTHGVAQQRQRNTLGNRSDDFEKPALESTSNDQDYVQTRKSLIHITLPKVTRSIDAFGPFARAGESSISHRPIFRYSENQIGHETEAQTHASTGEVEIEIEKWIDTVSAEHDDGVADRAASPEHTNEWKQMTPNSGVVNEKERAAANNSFDNFTLTKRQGLKTPSQTFSSSSHIRKSKPSRVLSSPSHFNLIAETRLMVSSPPQNAPQSECKMTSPQQNMLDSQRTTSSPPRSFSKVRGSALSHLAKSQPLSEEQHAPSRPQSTSSLQPRNTLSSLYTLPTISDSWSGHQRSRSNFPPQGKSSTLTNITYTEMSDSGHDKQSTLTRSVLPEAQDIRTSEVGIIPVGQTTYRVIGSSSGTQMTSFTFSRSNGNVVQSENLSVSIAEGPQHTQTSEMGKSEQSSQEMPVAYSHSDTMRPLSFSRGRSESIKTEEPSASTTQEFQSQDDRLSGVETQFKQSAPGAYSDTITQLDSGSHYAFNWANLTHRRAKLAKAEEQSQPSIHEPYDTRMSTDTKGDSKRNTGGFPSGSTDTAYLASYRRRMGVLAVSEEPSTSTIQEPQHITRTSETDETPEYSTHEVPTGSREPTKPYSQSRRRAKMTKSEEPPQAKRPQSKSPGLVRCATTRRQVQTVSPENRTEQRLDPLPTPPAQGKAILKPVHKHSQEWDQSNSNSRPSSPDSHSYSQSD